MHACTNAHTHTLTFTHTHKQENNLNLFCRQYTNILKNTHTYSHIHTHTHTYIHTHSHTQRHTLFSFNQPVKPMPTETIRYELCNEILFCTCSLFNWCILLLFPCNHRQHINQWIDKTRNKKHYWKTKPNVWYMHYDAVLQSLTIYKPASQPKWIDKTIKEKMEKLQKWLANKM